MRAVACWSIADESACAGEIRGRPVPRGPYRCLFALRAVAGFVGRLSGRAGEMSGLWHWTAPFMAPLPRSRR